MATTQAVWGVDVGRCALKAIKLKPAGDGKVEILAYEYVEHAKILTQPDADRPALIAAALEKFLSHHDISKDAVVVSVPGQHTLARFTKLPPVAPKRIPDIVRYEADQQIPFDMDEVIWDYQTFQREGFPDLEVGIFAMKRELIREHLLHFEQASIEPIGVQSGPLADYNAAHFDGVLGKDTTILVDIGAENTDLVVATPDSLWTRTIPMGGNTFTDALVKSFKLSFAKSESLKRTAAESKYARQVFQAMRPIFADVVQELQRSIGFYSSTHRDAKVEKLVGFGNAFQLPGLQKYLQQNLGLNVERPETFKNVVPTPLLEQETFKQNFLSFAVAYGLALQGLGVAKVNSNLLPTEIAKQVVWQKKRPAFAAAAACLLLAGGAVWFRYMSDMSALAASSVGWANPGVTEANAPSIIEKGPDQSLSDRARANAVLLAGNAMNKEYGKLTGQGAKERAETEKLVELQHKKTVIPRLLSIIHEAVPVQDGPLGEAKTQVEIMAALPSAPRPQRRQVFIDMLNMNYDPDLRTFKWDTVIEVPKPINSYEQKTGTEDFPGLIVKITCTTPNEGGSAFIRDHYMNRLRELGRKPDMGFYIDNVVLHEGAKIGGGRSAGRTTARTTTTSSLAAQNLDPVTGEATDDDWRFDIWASVILKDFPGEEAASKDEEPAKAAAPKGKEVAAPAKPGGKPTTPSPPPKPKGKPKP